MAWFPFNLRSSAPILMVSSFLAALAFSVDHHAFYQSLNDKSVLNSSPFSLTNSYHVSDQQVNVSIGTFFAFLVKALLGVAVSTVFDQFAWNSIRGHTSRIGIIDDLFSVLKKWFYDPRLLIVAALPGQHAACLHCMASAGGVDHNARDIECAHGIVREFNFDQSPSRELCEHQFFQFKTIKRIRNRRLALLGFYT